MTNDLGGLGDKSSARQTNYWAPYYHLNFSICLGVLLTLGLMFLPFNRQRRSWWIWGAIATSYGFGIIGSALLVAIGISDTEQIDQHKGAVLFSWGIACLLMPWITRKSRLGTWVATLVLIIVAGWAGEWFTKGKFPTDWELFFWALAIVLPALTIGIVLVLGRPNYRLGSLVSRFALFLWLAWILAPIPLVYGAGGSIDPLYILVTTGIAFSQLMYLTPFGLLLLFEPFYKERLYQWLKMPPTTPQSSVPTGQH